ncbi:hypothetical protein SRS16CHR_01799 [Variovorax sp. SRS16]|uniref:hypothetical protein n=1 Tax=Variovorax sp. SRS16 TaxID=282217 RepID=UPI0013192842|nr:hypothetical protein [Variovorax sp. SRS16]VTU16530.1 hypothetical protein SRS16CHR_01799 [Variovorax sp. SRS16]
MMTAEQHHAAITSGKSATGFEKVLEEMRDILASGVLIERPTVAEIAERSGVPAHLVQRVVAAIGRGIAAP